MTLRDNDTAPLAPDRRQWLGWLAAGTAGSLLSTPAGARTLARPTERFPQTRAYIDSYVATRKVPGAIIAIGIGDAAPAAVAAGTLAMDSRTAIDLDSLWRIYSMTKPITGMATMALIEDGRLTLDQPVADILPRFRQMRVLTAADAPVDSTVPATTPITIRQLLTHTAGLGYAHIQTGPIKAYYESHGLVPAQVTRLSLPGMSDGTPAPSLAAFADALAEAPLVYQPGSKWSYSVGLDLLGRVIEVVSGMPFDAFLQRRFFGPLGMASTGFRVSDAQAGRLATNYAPVGGALVPIDPAATSLFRDAPAFPFGGAGLVSSARDYDRFLHMLLGEGRLGRVRVLRPETARLGMSNLLPARVSTAGTFADGQGFGAGGRVSLPTSPGGAGVYGWGGAAGTVALVNTVRRLRIGGYANYIPADAYDFQRRAALVAMGDLTR